MTTCISGAILTRVYYYPFSITFSPRHYQERFHMCGCPCWHLLFLPFFRLTSRRWIYSPPLEGTARHERQRGSKTNSTIPHLNSKCSSDRPLPLNTVPRKIAIGRFAGQNWKREYIWDNSRITKWTSKWIALNHSFRFCPHWYCRRWKSRNRTNDGAARWNMNEPNGK